MFYRSTASAPATLSSWFNQFDMIEFDAAEWFAFREMLLRVRQFTMTPGREQGILLFMVQNRLDEFSGKLKEIGLPASREAAIRLKSSITSLAPTHSISELCARLAQSIEDESKSRVFIVLDPSLQERYTRPRHEWEVVIDTYPRIIREVEEASKCLALERPTATVFHCMRIMEHGLKLIARELGVPYAPSWESYIKQINERISAGYKDKLPEWREREPFFRDLVGDMIAVKTAWRNPTMHIVRDYMPKEASNVYASVRTFMRRLAEAEVPDVSDVT